MDYKNKFSILILLIFISGILILTLEASGLKTEFSELLLENLEIGKSYSFKNDFNYPFSVIYTGSSKIQLQIISAIPKKVKTGFKNIPDLKWLTIKPNNFIAKLFVLVFRSDRMACLASIKEKGYDDDAREMAEKEIMTIKGQ